MSLTLGSRLLVLCVLLSSLVFSQNSFAAVKAGDTCKKAGTTSTANGKKYTCVKSGKKLVWNKGAVVAAPKVSAPVGPSSFEDLEANYAGVPQAAWKKSADVLTVSKAKNGKLTVLIGPSTRPANDLPQAAISQVSRLFPNYQEAKEFVLIYFNFKDANWAQAEFDKYIGTDGGYDTSGSVQKICPSENGCMGGLAVKNQKTEISVSLITAGTTSQSDKRFLGGVIEAHEYFHTIQNAQFEKSSNNTGKMPRWLLEGSASFVENAAINYESFDKYKIAKASNIQGLLYRKGFNEPKLIEFLDAPSLGKDWSSWDLYDPVRVYDIGLLVTEIMVSIKGPESIMEQFKLVASGMTYQQSFEKVFGISWAEGVKVISKVLAKQIG
jgi:hypothetical protein